MGQDKEWDKHMKAGSKASTSFKFAKAETEFQAALCSNPSISDNRFADGGNAE